jgi:hypothetical protein
MPADVEDIDGSEDRVPSGEVEPMPVWAKAAPPPTDHMIAATAAAKVKLYPIVSLRCFFTRPADFKTWMGRNWFRHCLGITVSALARDRAGLTGRARCRCTAAFALTVGPDHEAAILILFAPM